MTALSIVLLARRLRTRSGRTAQGVLPVWPVVMLALALWGAACCSGASAVPTINAAPEASTPVVAMTDADWPGRSREDVVAALGKPLSAMQRGDTEVLMYAKDIRIEIRDDKVVAYRSGSAPTIVAGDGTRYNTTERGKVERILPPSKKAREVDADVATSPQAEPAASAIDVAPAKTVATPAPAAPVADAVVAPVDPGEDESESETWMGHTSEMPDGSRHPMAQSAESLAERGLLPMAEQPKHTPAWVRPVREIVGALLRFGFALLIIRIAISWAELPCYLPDVAKVAALFVIVREGVHGLVNLGGQWEWIRLFMIDDIVGYIALMILLFKFKVALSGIAALKIATATISVTYFLMLMVAVVLSFVIG